MPAQETLGASSGLPECPEEYAADILQSPLAVSLGGRCVSA